MESKGTRLAEHAPPAVPPAGCDTSHVFEAITLWKESMMTRLEEYNKTKKHHLRCIDELEEKQKRYENLKRYYETKLELEKENQLLLVEMAQKQNMVNSLNDKDAKSDKENLLENDATVVGPIDSSSSMNILSNAEKQVEVNISKEGSVEASGSKRTKRQREE